MRQLREGGLNFEGEQQARKVLGVLEDTWTEILPSDSLRRTAERLLAVHPLRAADAFQLAAALHWYQAQTANKDLVTFDVRLREAGHREGFTVLPAKLH